MVKKKKKPVKKKSVKKKVKAAKAKVKKLTKAQLAAAKRKANAELARARKKYLATEKKVKAFASKNPEKAAAIAAGLGVVVGASLGALLARGKRKR